MMPQLFGVQYLCCGIMSNPMSKWWFTLISGICTWTSHECPVTDLHGNQTLLLDFKSQFNHQHFLLGGYLAADIMCSFVNPGTF
jgi:hypothetical protein